jgi:hypothetical protein
MEHPIKLKTVQVVTFSIMGMLGANQISAETKVPNQFTSGTPAKASEVNENFSDLNSKIEAISKPESSYSVLSTETLDSGLVRTTLYAYELSDYSGYNRQDTFNPNLYLGEGTEHIINALGTFRGEWSYISDDTKTVTINNLSETSPIACPDGSAMIRSDSDARYSVTWRNVRGAFVFSNIGTMNAGIYGCTTSNFTADNGTTYDFFEYYYLEGKGAGIYSCVERAAWHGAYMQDASSSWDKVYSGSGRQVVTGVFDRKNNGIWGTYYLEIDAPADCLQLD